MTEFLYKMKNSNLEEALKVYFPTYYSMIDLFNIDLPYAGNMNLLLTELGDIIKNVAVRKLYAC